MEKIDRDDILLKIYQEQKEMKKQIGKMQEKIEGIPQMQEQIKLIPQMQEDIKELKEEVRKISGTVARIEVEHGEKLQILFDADLYKREKFDSQGHTLERHEKILDKQSDEIYLLKSKVQG